MDENIRLMNLTVVKDGTKTRIFLNNTEIKNVTYLNIKSPEDSPTELTLTMLVNYPVEQN
jgi:hypothetical protein